MTGGTKLEPASAKRVVAGHPVSALRGRADGGVGPCLADGADRWGGGGGSLVGASFPGGAAGVDLFFVISGFIMVHITSQRPVGPGQFMLDRAARIAPPYWLITLLMAAVLIVAPSVFRSASFDIATLITSLLFIPWPSTAVPGTAPLLQIGWTLNYEMLFYAIFALAMLIAREARIVIAAGAILALVSMQLFIPNDSNDFFQFYSSTIMIEFVFGMAIALVLQRYPVSPRVVACIAALDLRGPIPLNRTLLLLGNASYAIYLTHLFPLGAVRKVWPMMPAMVQQSDVLLLLSAALLALAVGVGFYLYVERPLVSLAKSAAHRLGRARTAAIAS